VSKIQLSFDQLFSRHGCAAQIPVVDDEMKKAAGDEKDEDIQMTQGIVQKLVTADGTYASQSAFSALLPVKKDQVRWAVFVFHLHLFLTAENLKIYFVNYFLWNWASCCCVNTGLPRCGKIGLFGQI